MARIRSIKPTIWTDERFIGLSRDARLLCIGMISHADDQGRLLATATKLAGDIFPVDDLKPSVVLSWRREIEESGLVTVYKVRGVEYAEFPRWGKHQRISKPQPSILPAPQPDPEPPAPKTRNHSAPKRGTVPPLPPEPVDDELYPSHAEARARLGDRRQETGVPPLAGAEPARAPTSALAVVPEPPTTAQGLVAEWIEHIPKRPPGPVIGQVGKHLAAMLGEGIDPDDVRRGLAEWARKGLHPSTLPSVVNEVMNRGPSLPDRRQQATNDLFDRAMERAAAREDAG